MLSRTANHLFWMTRYAERTESTAHMLNVNYQTSLMPQSAEVAEQGWWAILDMSELTQVFADRYGLPSRDNVIDFMVCDMTSPSSVMNYLHDARESVRAVHGSLTTEVWETINTTQLDVQCLIAEGILRKNPSQFFEWMEFRSHLSRSVQVGTMLTDDAFHFMQLRTFLGRTDSTARLLDVEFQSTPIRDESAAEQDGFHHWVATLRSVSGFEAYHKIYRNVITPTHVAELLILHSNIPRSLPVSMDEVVTILSAVCNSQSAETERRAGKLHADLRYTRIEDIFPTGLYVRLTSLLEWIGDLDNGISQDFLAPLEVA